MELNFKMNEFFSVVSVYLNDRWINKFWDNIESQPDGSPVHPH